jgi:hypothetical protein
MHPDVTFDGELPGGQARVGFRATSRSLARREGTDLIVAVAPSTPVAMQLAPLRKRTLPVELPPQVAPQYRRMIVEMIAPSSHQFTALPPDALEDGGTFGKASLTLTRSNDGRKVTMTRDVALAQSLISVAEYPAWRAWLQRIDALLLRSVRLERR